MPAMRRKGKKGWWCVYLQLCLFSLQRHGTPLPQRKMTSPTLDARIRWQLELRRARRSRRDCSVRSTLQFALQTPDSPHSNQHGTAGLLCETFRGVSLPGIWPRIDSRYVERLYSELRGNPVMETQPIAIRSVQACAQHLASSLWQER